MTFQQVPIHNARWTTPAGQPSIEFLQYIRELDAKVRALSKAEEANATAISTLETFAARFADNVAFADLPTGNEGDVIYVTDGLKNGETAGTGTGVLCFKDASNWIAVDTGTTVAA